MRIQEVLQSKTSDRVVTVSPETTVRQLVDALAEHNVGALVVSSDGTTADGIVSERDIVRQLTTGVELLDRPVSEIMTTDVHTCSPRDGVDELMMLMTEKRVRHVPVIVDDRLSGIVSIGDLVKSRIRELEFERDQLSSYVTDTR